MNILSLFVADFDDLTVDPRLDDHAVERLRRAETGQENRNIRARCLVRHDRDGNLAAARGRVRRGRLPPAPTGQNGDRTGYQQRYDQNKAAHFYSWLPILAGSMAERVPAPSPEPSIDLSDIDRVNGGLLACPGNPNPDAGD